MTSRFAGQWMAVAAVLALALVAPRPALAMPKYEKDFSAHVSLEQEYTDNLRLSSQNGGEEYINAVRPGFSVAAVSEASGIKADYDFAARYYWKMADEFIEHNARGNVWQQWENLRFDSGGSFSRSEYPIELRSGSQAIVGLRDTVSPYYRAGATPGFSWLFGAERFLRVGYNWSSYWSNDRRYQNSQQNAPNATLTYGLNQWNVVTLGYTFERASFSEGTFSNTRSFHADRANGAFTHRLSEVLNATASYSYGNIDFKVGPGYRTHNGTLGTSWQASEHTAVNLSAGYFLIDRGTAGSSKGPVINGSVTRAIPQGSLSLAGNYGFGEDYYSSENLGPYKYWSVDAHGSYELAERLSADATAGFHRNQYVLRGRTDDYWTAGAGLSYLLRPWLKGRASWAYNSYDSSAGAGFTGRLWDFNVNTYLLGLTATYD